MINHPNFDKWGISQEHEADPFVVAFAKKFDLIVVSYERINSTKNSIPAACRELGVQHYTFLEFLREEGYSV